MSRLVERIKRLEAALPTPPIPSPPSPAGLRFAEKLHELLKQMDPAYSEQVCQELKIWTRERQRSRPVQAGDLLAIVLHYVRQHIQVGTPLELPAEVLEAYVSDPEAAPRHECEDCGYRVPYTWGRTTPPRPPKIYFERCPLCRGKTGWQAFYFKHGYYKGNGGQAACEATTDRTELSNNEIKR